MDPELLIVDEPTTALDVSVQARVLDLSADAGPGREARPRQTWRRLCEG